MFSTPGSTAVSLTNVLFGDVWLCSGQSNMDFSVAHWGGGGCLDANETDTLSCGVPRMRSNKRKRSGDVRWVGVLSQDTLPSPVNIPCLIQC